MPIIRLRLQEEHGLVLPLEQAAYPGGLMPEFVQAGAVYDTYAPESLTDVTPDYWGSETDHRYILQMKKVAEAGILHIISKDNLPVVGVATSLERTVKNLAGGSKMDHIHIPAHQDIVPISRIAPRNKVEIGAIVMRATADILDHMHGLGAHEA